MKRHALTTAISLFTAAHALADHSELPEVVVKGSYSTIDFSYTRNGDQLQQPDSSALLSTIPGANINRNGPITGIPQYRGAYGNRINVTLDGAGIATGGPNSMDTPLSYVPSGLLDELRVSRGIASVSEGQETLGGNVAVTSQQGEFATGSEFETHAILKSSYTSSNSGTSNSAFVYTANSNHKLGLNVSYDYGQDSHYDGDDTVENSFYERARYNLNYGYHNGDTGFNLSLGRNETDDSGTPALPMDIIYIDSDLARAEFTTMVGETVLTAKASYSHADHGMDNASHRTPPSMAMMPMMNMNRYAHAVGRQLDTSFELQTAAAGGELTLGVDNHQTVHDTVITDPTNAMFRVDNFNDTEKDILGVYGEWEIDAGQWSLETGLRHNRVEMDANTVTGTGFSPMPIMGGMSMQGAVNTLVGAFNSSDLSSRENNLDAVIKVAYHLNSEITFGLGLARKNRSPSYQERYLWLPLKSTGGLADGRNYIGNTELDSETAHEINLGVDWSPNGSYLSLQAFYRDVDDYIQGTPSTNGTANMVSNMISMQAALQFNNVDAELYGADLGYGVQLDDRWRIDGTLSYVRGKRTDTSDNLYRIAPLNHRVTLSYAADHFTVGLESELYAEQGKVSSYNSEEKTSGYGLLHLRAQAEIGDHFSISTGVENLLEQKHQNHLGGYNRVQDSDIAIGDRLYGTGRSAYVNLTYSW